MNNEEGRDTRWCLRSYGENGWEPVILEGYWEYGDTPETLVLDTRLGHFDVRDTFARQDEADMEAYRRNIAMGLDVLHPNYYAQ